MKKTILNFIALFLLLLSSAGQLQAQKKTARDTALFLIETVDGNTYTGHIVSQDLNAVRFKTTNIGEITIQMRNIKNMKPIGSDRVRDGAYWFENPHSSRYFWGPSGYGLKKGEGYYQNIYVLWNQASYGFTDYFTLGAVVIPTFLFGGPTPFALTPKFSFPVVKNKFNVGVGALYLNVLGADTDDFNGAGLLYGMGTYGTRDNNVSLGVGWGYAIGEGLGRYPTFSLSGIRRTGKNWSFLTENYFISTGDESLFLLSLGGRYMTRNFSFDFLFMRPFLTGESSGDFIAFPLLGVTFPFGK